MNEIVGMLANQLGGQAIAQIGNQIGADEGTTQSAVGMALPMLLSAMGQQANSGGADAIHQAAQENDGSILDDVMGFVGNASAGGIGGALLGQVMGGGTQNNIVNTISQNTGLNAGAAGQLLAILTPLVMGAIGKASQQQGGLDAGGIAQMLGGLAGGGNSNDLLGMATRAIDADGDGNIIEDIGGIVGKIF
jgi:hypothetical protein